MRRSRRGRPPRVLKKSTVWTRAILVVSGGRPPASSRVSEPTSRAGSLTAQHGHDLPQVLGAELARSAAPVGQRVNSVSLSWSSLPRATLHPRGPSFSGARVAAGLFAGGVRRRHYQTNPFGIHILRPLQAIDNDMLLQ